MSPGEIRLYPAQWGDARVRVVRLTKTRIVIALVEPAPPNYGHPAGFEVWVSRRDARHLKKV